MHSVRLQVGPPTAGGRPPLQPSAGASPRKPPLLRPPPAAAIDALFSAAATCSFTSLVPPRRPGLPVQKQRSRLFSAGGAGSAAPAAEGSPGSDADGSPGKQRSLTSVLARMKRSVTKRMGSAPSSPEPSPEAALGGLQAAAEQGIAAGEAGGAALPPIAEVALSMAAPQPPVGLAGLEEAEAWLWDSRTWATLRWGPPGTAGRVPRRGAPRCHA